MKQLFSKRPILPNGVETEEELNELRAAAERNFGSLRLAALHHLTGASGIAPNVHGKSVFTFWTRKREIAIRHGLSNHPGRSGFQLVLITTTIEAGPDIVSAEDEGLYNEKIAATLPDTFSEFREEDEVFVAIPVLAYDLTVIDARAASDIQN